MKKIVSIFLVLLSLDFAQSQTIKVGIDSLCGVPIKRDKDGKLLSRYYPGQESKAYKEVLKITADFVVHKQPIDATNGKSMLFTTCCFEGPHMKKSTQIVQGKSIGGNEQANFTAVYWPHNPACVFGGFTQSLALDMYPFTGDKKYVKIVGQMLDYMIERGTTPSNYVWANVPYASSDAKDTIYMGSSVLEKEDMRGDGLHGIEPDKIGEMGYAYIKYYQISGDAKYLNAALGCADALAKHVNKNALGKSGNFETTQTRLSPWPFRLNARSGKVHDPYCAHVIDPIKMFDELLRISNRIQLDTSRIRKYKEANDLAYAWLMSKNGPMKTYVWNAYFEDIPGDNFQSNRNQVSPMETARYFLKYPNKNKNWEIDVQALIYYVKSAFGDEYVDAIKEQTWCYEPMASHTSRYASVCAMFYQKTGNIWFKEQALRHFNYATYAVEPSGAAWVGHTWPGSWWSDGYSDFIKHYFDGMAAVPEWAPADENHLIKSNSAVISIEYKSNSIEYQTYDKQNSSILRLKSKPKSILVDGKQIGQGNLNNESYSLKPLGKNWVLEIKQTSGTKVLVNL